MGSLQKIYLCLALAAVCVLTVTGQRNRYSNNNYNNNNQNGGFNYGSSVCDDEENPCEEGKSLSIPCPAPYSGGQVISCLWKHQLPTVSNGYSDSRHVSCGGNGCAGSPDLDQTYIQGRSVQYSQDPCVLQINQAHPDDSTVGNSGEWECHLQTDDGTANGLKTVVGTVDVFISNASEIYITDPSDGDSVEYDLGNSRPVEATCTAYGGLPVPTFRWYIDDDDRNNEIQDGDGDASISTDSYNDRNGRRAESTISFSPDLQTLCDLNLDEACDVVNGDTDFNGINFNLVCKVEQNGQYQDVNNRQEATVMVEMSSANQLVFVTCWHLMVLLGLGLRLLS